MKIVDVKGAINLGATTALVIGYMLTLRSLGFLVATFVFCTLSMLLLRVMWLRSVVFSVIITLVMYWVFGSLFRLPLPRGIFSF